MSLIRRAAAQLSERRGANPALPWGDSTPVPNSLLGTQGAGGLITGRTAVQVSAVYGAVGLIADSVSSLPLQLRDGPDIATSKPVAATPLLAKPFSEISLIDFWKQFVWALALRGEFFGQIIERDRLGYAVQIKPIHNDFVQIRRLDNGQLEYRYYGIKVQFDDVVHVRYQSMPGEVHGLNPIEVCGTQLGLALAQDRYAESFFLNSANPMGVIQVPGPLDRSETRKMLRGWVAAHQGINKANLPAILTEDAKFQPITISPSDSQMLEVMQFSEQRIAGRIFRVPPHMIGIVDRSTSWGKGIEQQERGFFTNTLISYLTIGANLLTSLTKPGLFARFDTSERLRGTALERAQTGSLAMLAGAWCADDFRDSFDMPPLPDGNGQLTYAPINTELLEMALELLDQAKHPPEPPSTDGPGDPTNPAAPPPAKPKVAARSNGHGNQERAVQLLEQALGRR